MEMVIKKQDHFKLLPNTMLTRTSKFVHDCNIFRTDRIILRNLADRKISGTMASTLIHYSRKSSSITLCERYNDAVRKHRLTLYIFGKISVDSSNASKFFYRNGITVEPWP